MTFDAAAFITQCENEIRAGLSASAAAKLSSIERADVPAEFRFALANLCRRVGLVRQGLKLLAPTIQADRDGEAAASPKELAEYAALLQREGATHEALLLLARVKAQDVPEVLLFRAFCHFSRWDYESAVPLLRDYLAQPIPDYAKIVGRVNLASSLIATGENSEAASLLEELIVHARGGNFRRLVVNCLEMRAQVRINAGDFAKAREDLAAAAETGKGEKSLDVVMVRKWTAILGVLEGEGAEDLLKFRAEAVAASDWESAREADLYRLKASFDEKVFDHLYFGTPYAGYRRRIQRELGRQPVGETFLYGPDGGVKLNISSGESAGGSALKFGSKLHRLVQALSLDFYRPASLGALFAALFPDEYFNVFTSPSRIRQLISRERKWFVENGFNLTIEESGGSYALTVGEGMQIEVPIVAKSLDTKFAQFEVLTGRFSQAGGFTALEGKDALEVSDATFKRLMKWAIDKGLTERVGATTSTYYKIVAVS